MHKVLYSLKKDVQLKTLKSIIKWANSSRKFRKNYLPLNFNQLKILSNSNLIEIGSHGLNHYSLANQDIKIQKKEIFDSKRKLEKILKKTITMFSYPYGWSSDINQITINLVKKAGYKCACSTNQGCVTNKSNFFLLPRYIIKNIDGKEFKNQLKIFFRKL